MAEVVVGCGSGWAGFHGWHGRGVSYVVSLPVCSGLCAVPDCYTENTRLVRHRRHICLVRSCALADDWVLARYQPLGLLERMAGCCLALTINMLLRAFTFS